MQPELRLKTLEKACQQAKLNAERDRNEYEKITQLLPNDAPQSLGCYRRMKKANSKNFEVLSTKAAACGIEIHAEDTEPVLQEKPVRRFRWRDDC